MADDIIVNTQLLADKRLNTTRETELLQSFVRVNIENNDDAAITESLLNKSEIQQNRGDNSHHVADDNKKQTTATTTAAHHDEANKSLLTQQLSQEITKKMKKKKKQNGNNRQQEIYCDKDRAAAVNMGSKDIKHSLKMKRRQDRSKALQIPEEAEPSTFLALGNYEMCRGDLQIALNFISKVYNFPSILNCSIKY